MDHTLSDVKNQVILIAIAASWGGMFHQRAFPKRIGMEHDEDVGWSQWCHGRPLVSRTVPGMIVMAAMADQRDPLRLNSNHTQEFSRTGRIIFHRVLSQQAGGWCHGGDELSSAHVVNNQRPHTKLWLHHLRVVS